jgi:hypothetical protein
LAVVAADGSQPPRLVTVLPEELRPARWVTGPPRYVAAVGLGLDSLELREGRGARVNASVRLADGREGDLAVRWSTTDSAAARVDDVGFVRGVSPGTTFLVASAGGFRADTIPVAVLAASVDTLLVEDWERGLDSTRWIPFGSPWPVVARDPRRPGRTVFWNNGDYNHSSGVLSTEVFEVGREGLTLEAEGWLAFTGGHWQIWALRLGCDPPPFVGPELFCGGPVLNVEGPSPTIASPRWHCGGPAPRDWDPAFGRTNGTWHAFALQIRPDGYYECLINGRLLERNPVTPAAAGRVVRVALGGLSVATGIHHGRVVLTRGLRY